jgi:hypothetical protein
MHGHHEKRVDVEIGGDHAAMLVLVIPLQKLRLRNEGSGEDAVTARVIAAAGLAKPYPQGRDCAWRACVGADVPACGGNVLASES